MPGEMTVPTDWSPEDGYRIGIIFFPDSLQWLANVHGCLYVLTRGRAYDFDTGYFKIIEKEAEKVWESFMSGNLTEITSRMDEFTKTQRMIVAALMGQSVNFDTEPLPNAINYEQGIRQAILSVGGSMDGGLTLGELVVLMEAQDGPDYGFKDWLEILRLFQELFNGASLVPIAAVGGLISLIFAARTQHNTLAIQAMQATALRGIQNAIAPPKDPATEETTVKNWMDGLEKIPFLTTAIIALVDPSPTGEGVMAAKIALTIKNLLTTAWGWLSDWWNVYVSTVANPQPQGTVVGMLAEISRKVQSLADETSTPTVTVSNRLKAISDAIANIETETVDLTPALVEIAAQLNDIALPNGVTWQGIFTSLEGVIGDSVPVINVTCGSCGSSSGCGCGGSGGSGAYGPGVGGPTDNPPASVPESGFPPGFPDTPAYNAYKCKAANTLVLNLAETLAQFSGYQNTNLEQFTLFNNALGWLAGKISLMGASLGGISADATSWIADKIMLFLWPYPNAANVGLGIFDEIRLSYLVDQQDAVCELYVSEDTSEARSAIETRLDGYIDATSFTSEVKAQAKEIYKALLSNTWLGRLFQKDSFIETASSSGFMDCTDCEADFIFELFDPSAGGNLYGSLNRSGSHYTGASEFGNGSNRLNIRVGTEEGVPGCLYVYNLVITGSTHTGDDDYYWPCGGGGDVPCPSGNANNVDEEDIHRFLLASNAPFTISFDTLLEAP